MPGLSSYEEARRQEMASLEPCPDTDALDLAKLLEELDDITYIASSRKLARLATQDTINLDEVQFELMEPQIVNEVLDSY